MKNKNIIPTESKAIETEQATLQKAKDILSLPVVPRFFHKLFAKRDVKEIYKIISKKNANSNEEIDTNFNTENAFEVHNFNFWYNNHSKQALKDINLKIRRNKVTALIGPSGCGKSTFIRCLNRMNDQIDGTSSDGKIYFDKGINLRSKKLSTLELTTRVGMIFQKPSPFPMSIYENIAYGPRSHGINNLEQLDKIVEESLKGAAL
jgi:phosphate transport system ATP-binding protein